MIMVFFHEIYTYSVTLHDHILMNIFSPLSSCRRSAMAKMSGAQGVGFVLGPSMYIHLFAI